MALRRCLVFKTINFGCDENLLLQSLFANKILFKAAEVKLLL